MAATPGEIILYKNDGSGEENYVAYNAPSINDIEWSRDGYNFIEWNTEPDGTGDSYLPGDFVGDGSHNPPLYAIWKEIPVLQQKQPLLTYSVNWGTNNVFQKLSGKTYVSPSGQTIDCSTLTVTFSSSQHFKKFYATAVKSGNDYGFIDDVLVDIRETNPTGILLYELTERDANVNFSFTINTSSLTSGDGEYRIGLYVQNDDGIWNYEYFLLEANNLQLEESNNLLLQVPVQNEWEYNDMPPSDYFLLCVDQANKIMFLFDTKNQTVLYNTGFYYLNNIDRSLYNNIFQANSFNYHGFFYMDNQTFLKYANTAYNLTSLEPYHLACLYNQAPQFFSSRGQNDVVGPPLTTVLTS